MIMIGHIMSVAMIGMHHINDFLVSVTMIRDLRLMVGDDLGQFRQIV